MSQPLIWNLNIDRVLSENAICTLNHLISVLFRKIVAIRIDGGLEWTLLPGRSPSKFFGIITQKSIAEENIKVTVNLLSLLCIDRCLIAQLDIIYTTNCQ